MASSDLLPKITVVTPSFNQCIYLEECVKSVINQNYPNLEYIIMDGGSNDGSISVIKKYSNHLYYWQSKSDKGQADAIKQGFDRATGEIFAWLNSDDLMCKDALFEVAKVFSKDKSIGLLYGDAFLINQKTELKRALISCQIDYKRFIHGASNVFQGSVFFSKSAYNKVGGINTRHAYAMEYELFFQILKLFNGSYLPKFLACFRSQPLSKGSTIPEIGRSEKKEILKQLEQINLDSSMYKLKRFYFMNERRIKNVLLGKTWVLRKPFYKKIFTDKLSHIQ